VEKPCVRAMLWHTFGAAAAAVSAVSSAGGGGGGVRRRRRCTAAVLRLSQNFPPLLRMLHKYRVEKGPTAGNSTFVADVTKIP